MTRLIAAALLLAGCAPAPKPKEIPLGDASQEAKITLEGAPANPCAAAERQRDQMLVNFEKLYEAFERLDRTNEKLLEIARKRAPGSSTVTIYPPPLFWQDTTSGTFDLPDHPYDLGGTSSGGTKKNPFRRAYFEEFVYCNVWADDKGIHWEECK